jgi:predicted Zn-dependent protease with MMP-like domain
MDENTFSRYVSEAIDAIPDQYQESVASIRFKVEREPSTQQRKELGMRHCDALFGLYEGVPLPNRGGQVRSILPDTITVFMHPMVDLFPDEKALKTQIRKTVWHEVAHHFGLDHDRIHALENKMTTP